MRLNRRSGAGHSPFVKSASMTSKPTGPHKEDAARAKDIGLAHAVVPAAELDAKVGFYVNEFLSAGPDAISRAKALIPRGWARGASSSHCATRAWRGRSG